MSPPLESINGEATNLTQDVQNEEDGIVFALSLISSIMLPLTVRSAVELGIFDILAKAKKGVMLSANDIST
ncbi:putative caffeate O-methyltransferase [Medicago truncatula]|uniref:Putative caffeate O-methyltransferase n=1 Tax=Medicago truncatula TaxID=3880 RepID=A0A396GLU6_MEDTR|nr:putative caffeate O-methyltransferase [Medicago truncatula]